MNSRRAFLLLASAVPALDAGQDPGFPRLPSERERDKDEPVRFPNGKLQQDEILKADYRKTVADCKELVKLAQDLQADVEKNEQYVISLTSIKQTEEIEKLARRIRGRIKRT